jgi:hypothetical protein
MNEPRPVSQPVTKRFWRRRFAHTIWPVLAALAVLAIWNWFAGDDGSGSDARSAARPVASGSNSAPGRVAPSGSEDGTRAPAEEIQLASHAGNQDSQDPDAGADSETDKARRRAAGEWEDDYQGKRHLVIRENGTATMVVEPSGIGKLLFADRLTFEIEWEIEAGRITMRMVGGEPKKKIDAILRWKGDRATYSIAKLDDKQLLLVDVADKKQYDWRRVK